MVYKYNMKGGFFMKKILILHDLPQEKADTFLPKDSSHYTVFSAIPAIHPCIGCFGCWLKTPGKCVIKDRGSDFLALLSTHDEVIFMSRLVFGGLSPDIKAFLDRSIGFVLPSFNSRNGEMHHPKRYGKEPGFQFIYYGADITEREKETAIKLAASNSLNLCSERYSILFYRTLQESMGVLV
jgi:hypothetical protein